MSDKPYKPAWWRRYTTTRFVPGFGYIRTGCYYPFKFQADYDTDTFNYVTGKSGYGYFTISCKELDKLIEQDKEDNAHN